MERSSGILLPVSSLPSDYGIGCFSESAYSFVDWLAGAGQRYWQILPLGPTGYGDSPYQSFSTFAGNPYFISLKALVAQGLLNESECGGGGDGDSGVPGARVPGRGTADRVDYVFLYRERLNILRKAFHRSSHAGDKAYRDFLKENNFWLEDFALFMALKKHFGEVPFSDWPEEIRSAGRTDAGKGLGYYKVTLADEMDFHKYLQYEFDRQWKALKAYANGRGVKIIGDIPIYVAMDSADTWANPELFELDGDGVPTAVAGCPPDGFSATGQLWGNPLYRWEKHRETGYEWWIRRLRHCFDLYDVVRIDHFRGFDEYFSVPYGSLSAIGGHWVKGPGREFFDMVQKALGAREYIAEDLGYVTDSVRRLVADCGFAGMKVLEFAFDSRDTGCARDYLPHNYPVNSIAYTGTHDNETIVGWFGSIKEEERQAALSYLRDAAASEGESAELRYNPAKAAAPRYNPAKAAVPPGYGSASLCSDGCDADGCMERSEELAWDFIELVMRSRARLCVIPMQDYLGLDNSCRMNTPSTLGNNWQWRVRREQLDSKLQERIRGLAEACGRT